MYYVCNETLFYIFDFANITTSSNIYREETVNKIKNECQKWTDNISVILAFWYLSCVKKRPFIFSIHGCDTHIHSFNIAVVGRVSRTTKGALININVT